MSGLCQYRHVFGIEGEGVHAYRLGGVAIVDTAMTLLAGAGIAYLTHQNLILVWAVLFALGIILHRLFCVNTALNVALLGRV